MGMFDTVYAEAICPACGMETVVAVQTKDLECLLHTYRALPLDWETNETLGRPFREKLPVFPAYPLDKGARAWKSQAEEVEAQATPPQEAIEQLKFIRVCEICEGCGSFWEGKVMIVNSLLRSPVQDVKVIKSEPKRAEEE